MGFNIKDLKRASSEIEREFRLSARDASQVVGFYNGGHEVNPEKVQSLIDGDFSEVGEIMERLGITGSGSGLNGTKEEKKPKRETPKAKKKERETEKGARQVSQIPAVDGEVVTDNKELPEGFGDRVEGWFNDYANKYGFDIYKLHAQQWRSACMYVGVNIKQSHVLDNVDYIRTHGGRGYSGEKLEKLLTLWAYFCGIYKQVPLVHDFVNFSGVSRTYFYDYDGRGLSSASVQILKKAREIEENGLGSSVAGGGAGAVGGMFLLKTRHGYSETVTIQHTTNTTALGVSDLPKLEELKGE